MPRQSRPLLLQLLALGPALLCAHLGASQAAAVEDGGGASASSAAMRAGAAEVEESGEGFSELIIALFAAAYMLLFVVGNFLHRKHISILPESVVAIGLGVAVGALFRSIPQVHFTDSIKEEGHVNTAILMYFLLPIIIFESGWSLQRQDFFSQIVYILLFAVVGTVISMLVVGSLILATSGLHGIRAPRTAFAYAALISAVDPVATLATYSHLAVDPLLNLLVFGESVVNDAVAIALFRVLNDPSVPGRMFDEEGTVGETTVRIVGGVCELLFGSIGLGLALGCLYILVLRFGRLRETPALGILFIFVSCLFTYSFAEGVCGMSGIITVLFCAILMRCYATPHLTVEGRLLTSFLLKQMAVLSDNAVFFFVGIALAYLNSRGLQFGCWVMLFCLLGRAAAVWPLGCLTNCIKNAVGRDTPPEKRLLLSWRHMFMMFHAGLRGGIALVLTLELGGWVDRVEGGEAREVLRNATLVLICAFLLVFGGTTEVTLKALGIPMGAEVAEAGGELPREEGEEPKKSCGACLRGFHKSVMLKVLVGQPTEEAARTYMRSGSVVAEVLAEAGDAKQQPQQQQPQLQASGEAVAAASLAPALGALHREDIYDLFGADVGGLTGEPRRAPSAASSVAPSAGSQVFGAPRREDSAAASSTCQEV